MNVKAMRKRFLLAYFSGTGCTKKVCELFEECLTKMGADCVKVDMAVHQYVDLAAVDTIIVFSPVYAFRMTSLAEKWVKALPPIHDHYRRPAVIISVSGGGEISPNTACRNYCKRVLKKKGYDLLYEKMLVMPSNFATTAEESLNLDLLRVLPHKVKKIVADILSGEKRITTPKFRDRFLSKIGICEHFGARFFGAFIRASRSCTGCGLCVDNCPQKNIRFKDGLPKFGFRCMWCMKCIYNCPNRALSPRLLKFSVLKSGFDLKKINEKALKEPFRQDYKNRKSQPWQGVIEYLSDDDIL